MTIIIDGTLGVPVSPVTGTLAVANGGTGTTSTTFVNLATNVTGTLPVANGGTGVTAASTGTGGVVLSASPTLTGTPLSTTAASATNTTQIATTAFAYGTLSNAASGYTKLANGLIIQWKTESGTGTHGPSYSYTFPLTFPTAVYSIAATVQQGVSTGTTQLILPITALSTTGFTIQYGTQNGASYTYSYRYIAIGI